MIQFALQACVARSVPRSEMRLNKDAMAAMNAEWMRLRTAQWSSQDNNTMDVVGCWDETLVMEYGDVVEEANRLNETWHFGRLLELCVETSSELPEREKNRKWKGRVVLQGDQVRTQNYEVAVFSDMASQPATLEASAAADFYRLLAAPTRRWQTPSRHTYRQDLEVRTRRWYTSPSTNGRRNGKTIKRESRCAP